MSEISVTVGDVDEHEWLALVGDAHSHAEPRWLRAVCRGLAYEPHVISARRAGRLAGVLPLALVSSRLFGRFLVGLPYVNSAGVVAGDDHVARALVDHAVRLADDLRVRNLELRHEREVPHDSLSGKLTSKVHMRLDLPDDEATLWNALKAKVRNQVRKGEKTGLTVAWGRTESLADFYEVFARNMRDLGTPVYGRKLFLSILDAFGTDAEFCVVRHEHRVAAAALLVHGRAATEVPSASSARSLNWTNANMFMYWQLLRRGIERGRGCFDFGRSTIDSSTYKFKKQWGAAEHPAVWQYYVREGTVGEMRPDSGKYGMAIRMWQKLPVWATKVMGPRIVRGIP